MTYLDISASNTCVRKSALSVHLIPLYVVQTHPSPRGALIPIYPWQGEFSGGRRDRWMENKWREEGGVRQGKVLEGKVDVRWKKGRGGVEWGRGRGRDKGKTILLSLSNCSSIHPVMCWETTGVFGSQGGVCLFMRVDGEVYGCAICGCMTGCPCKVSVCICAYVCAHILNACLLFQTGSKQRRNYVNIRMMLCPQRPESTHPHPHTLSFMFYLPNVYLWRALS